MVLQGQDVGSHTPGQADPTSAFGRRPTSMSAGNLTDLGGYQQPGAVENLLGTSMAGPLRVVASGSNIWDGQVRGSYVLAGSVILRLAHSMLKCRCMHRQGRPTTLCLYRPMVACMVRAGFLMRACCGVTELAVVVQNMPSSPSSGSQWAQLNQNTWPSTGGSSEQAALQAQAQALALQMSLSGNLDQVLHRSSLTGSADQEDLATTSSSFSKEGRKLCGCNMSKQGSALAGHWGHCAPADSGHGTAAAAAEPDAAAAEPT